MQQTIHISTPAHNGLYDITRQVEGIVSDSGVKSGMVNVLQILRSKSVMKSSLRPEKSLERAIGLPLLHLRELNLCSLAVIQIVPSLSPISHIIRQLLILF